MLSGEVVVAERLCCRLRVMDVMGAEGHSLFGQNAGIGLS